MEAYIGNTKYGDIKKPNTCPHCHHANAPTQRFQQRTFDTDNQSSNIQVWQCENDECKKLFVLLIKKSKDNKIEYKFLNGLPKGPNFPQPINDLKDGSNTKPETPAESRFKKIYLQSLIAEFENLDEIAGMGYRKALEVLVKDWAIQNNPNDSKAIMDSWLAAVIQNYYSGDLKEILEKATWLGNDQSHYLKLFDDFDVEDIKVLLDLIMADLDKEFKKQHYITSVQKKK